VADAEGVELRAPVCSTELAICYAVVDDTASTVVLFRSGDDEGELRERPPSPTRST
jgi:hypothetical protein